MKKITVLFICAAFAIGIGIGAATPYIKDFSFPQITMADTKPESQNDILGKKEAGEKPNAGNYDQLHDFFAHKTTMRDVHIDPDWAETKFTYTAIGSIKGAMDITPVWSVPIILRYESILGKQVGPEFLEAYWRDGKIQAICEPLETTTRRVKEHNAKVQSGAYTSISDMTNIPDRRCAFPGQ